MKFNSELRLYRIVIKSQQIGDNTISLSSEQGHYLRRVLRLNDGDEFIALDGKGNCWQVKLTSSVGEIVTSLEENSELPLNVTLIVALPKGNGFDDIIRCTTELGVTHLQPVTCDRTLVKPKENKLNRWIKIAEEATEQCERQIIPTIASPLPVSQVFQRLKSENIPKYIASPRVCVPHLSYYQSQFLSPFPDNIVVATGCEGGWTPQEIEGAIASGFQEVSLGKRILRAVTAPIMVMSVIAGLVEKQTNLDNE